MYEIYAKQVGAEIIKTESSQHNLKEFSNLYKKYGFKLAGIRKEYYSDNKEDAMIMWNDIKVV